MLAFVSEWANSQFGIIGSVVLFVLGLAALIKGGDWFVDGSVGIAKKLHVPELLIGATVVSIGTTLPEVMVSATSAAKGLGSIAYGNEIGSVICNTALIAALTVAIRPALVNRRALALPVVCFFIAAIFYCGVAIFARRFSRPVGIILLVMFAVYMVLTVLHAKKHPDEAEDEESEKDMSTAKAIVLLIVGAALIAVGANFLVDNGTIIAKALGVPDTVIALTFVALGTSLPELVTAITSLAKGHGALSLFGRDLPDDVPRFGHGGDDRPLRSARGKAHRRDERIAHSRYSRDDARDGAPDHTRRHIGQAQALAGRHAACDIHRVHRVPVCFLKLKI